jgi:methyl-accepting chemotaxis protein
MEAATPLPFAQVHVRHGRLVVDSLVLDDEVVVRLAGEASDPVKLLADAAAIGARVLDREQTAAHADYVKAELERVGREVDAAFTDKARVVAEHFGRKVDEVFSPEAGVLSRALERHFSDDSSGAVQHRVRAVMEEVMGRSREELVRQFSSAEGTNPLAGFQRAAVESIQGAAAQQHAHLREMNATLEGLRRDLVELRAEKERLEQVAAEVERGTAKGRTFEEDVHEALDRLALAQGDTCEAVGDLKESTGKKGDVVVAIGACHGPSQGRIVFEAKNSRLTRPRALEELDGAMAERNADFAVLVVASEEKVPARMLPLREYNGDKLIVAYDPEDAAPLALQVAYALARARVLMTRGGGEGIDPAAVRDTAERAINAMEDVRRVKQQLTGAKTQIDKAAEIVESMAARVRGHLDEIRVLLAAGSPAAPALEPGDAPAALPPADG